ncbi:MAG: glycosyltransferase [Phycisphaerales bacterium]|nr:MAG: glycosyltransferase [Phycisphaerales bacterium]
MSSGDSLKISIVMVDGAFREQFHTVDFLARQTIPADQYELLWIEYYDTVKAALEEKIRRQPGFRIVTLGRQGTYHSSYCFNAGIEAARGELLVILDADVVVEDDFLETVLREHRANPRLVMYVSRYDEPEDQHLPDTHRDRLRNVCLLKNPTNYGGCLTVRKKWLMKINGYEQHPVFGTGFHANGLDVYTRLKNLGLHVMWHPELKLYHPWHESTVTKADSYKLQQLVIRHRALSKEVLAFQGIDSSRDHEIPATLAARLESARQGKSGLARRFCARVRTALQRHPGSGCD